MIIINSPYRDPFHNFALEELLLKNTENINEDILLIYRNKNSIIIGRNQNTHEEINKSFVKDKNITVARRTSGGGAVYHDDGNVNFCFITSTSKKNSFADFLSPIINFLKSLDINAEFIGKNDIVAEGYKISGNAQYKFKDKIFHHGTLLFDSDLSILGKALTPNKLKLESKSIKSTRKRVTNIKDLLKEPISTNEFIKKLINFFESKDYKLSKDTIVDIKKVESLAIEKSSEAWNYGKNPKFNLENTMRFDGGTIKLNLDVENNIIQNIKIEGDFLSSNNFENIFKKFIKKKYEFIILMNILEEIPNFKDFFGKITKEEIMKLFEGVQ